MAVKERIIHGMDIAGLSIFEPLVRLVAGEDPKEQFRALFQFVGIPILAFGLFLVAWSATARTIETKYGTLPTPAEVWREAGNLIDDHYATRAKETAYYAAQQEQIVALREARQTLVSAMASAEGATRAKMSERIGKVDRKIEQTKAQKFSSSPTYIDQILTSLKTVFAGFLIASLLAIPIGILCGLSRTFQAAFAPLIQIFKPVSPLAWLPIVMIVVGALYTTDPREAWFEKSFISSAFTVALCSLWPTLTNTALGVASIEKDHLNVAAVLQLDFWTRIRKIVLPSSLPLMFAGLRISLGVGWMVLIAAEMLAQNPGLGKFVWDMFQNGSSQTLAQIMVAVFTIGLIGFALDRVMVTLQRSVSYDSTVST
jgi:nitrate/nitrite transport system permease protein